MVLANPSTSARRLESQKHMIYLCLWHRYNPTHKTAATCMSMCLSKCGGLLKECRTLKNTYVSYI